MPVSPARAAAFDILLRVESESSYASELLHSSASQKLSHADHALATELVMGVLRWRSRLDTEIAAASSQPLKKLDLEVIIALRLALYQFRWLDRIPERAALHESVELVKRARKRSAAPYVNAVLRKLAAQAKSAEHAPEVPLCNPVPSVVNSFEELAEVCAHPVWLTERWTEFYGLAVALKICEYDQSPPSTALRLRKPDAERNLVDEGITLHPGALLSSSRRVQSGDIRHTQAFRRHEVVIQDEASQLVAALSGRINKDAPRILDCCAAPGGKTLAIADRNPSASVTAVEIHPHRARLMQRLLGTDTSSQIKTVVADARTLPLANNYDAILTDVPCSGTGTLARNPEIKWRLKPEDFAELHERQLAILRSAVSHLAPGGRLAYSTCSLEKEENEDVVEAALAENSALRLLDARAELARLKAEGELACPDPDSLTRGPYLRTIPGVHPCDGFFAAIVEKS
ncbi:MAG TPA: 16S rRNA (cytosine(967)-C(5))-methyltransferase RsmB [Candidatus Sulfotelmatobacter sp.]|nr:16S rRNA (cytosine(967)-C(5))-methyltransferase RsmB [Candidatus Sulfotelmatobacter sp.]